MIYWIAASVFILDRVAKCIAINHLFLGRPVKVIPGVFNLTLVLNSGTAFGLFQGHRLLFIILSIVIVTAIVSYILKHKNMPAGLSWPLGLILGGASGNLLDRIWFGRVIDFFDFRIWPVFNIADSCITVGVIILAFNIWVRGSKSKA